jgi:CRISPR-associated endonuclease Csn1
MFVMDEKKRFRVGIDVGLNSVGLAAIEVSESGVPVSILNMESVIHDSGVEEAKTAKTRKAVSGVARRMRRLIRRRKQRLAALDEVIVGFGWPLIDLESVSDPYWPWRVRQELVTHQVIDPVDLYEKLSVALRHLARHRGWRNPYTTVATLIANADEPSEYFVKLVDAIRERPGWGALGCDMSVAEIVAEALRTDLTARVRGTRKDIEPLLEGKIHQSDNVRELKRIWQMQGLPEDQFKQVVESVFAARSPKGSAIDRVGKDPLPGMSAQPRAEKASLAFQRYRIAQVVANLRIRDDGSTQGRSLSRVEKDVVTSYLWKDAGRVEGLSWDDVAAKLGIDRKALVGTAKETELGERSGGRPPINVTDRAIRESKIKPLVAFWDESSEVAQEALITVLSNGSGSGDNSAEAQAAEARATEFVAGLPEEVMGKLENIKLPAGRAAYSAKSLRLLAARMMDTDEDLHEARKAVFGVDDSWTPPADPIGLPVGNPAVDRTTKIVARYLAACESTWGAPLSVNVESTREGFVSEKTAREDARQRNRNAADNEKAKAEIPREFVIASRQALGDEFVEVAGESGARRKDLYRYRAYSRQNGKCLYCGRALQYGAFEMDHIVPRAGQGATNTQVNLAAVCKECNHLKGKTPFAVWAKTPEAQGRGVDAKEAVKRVESFFSMDSSRTRRDREFIKSMKERLTRKEDDEPIDNRSAESVGWMANELRHRIERHYEGNGAGDGGKDTNVKVFAGWVTDAARKASGMGGRIEMTGGKLVRDTLVSVETGEMKRGKNRLDRRHHAIDAATIAMLRPGAAQSLDAQGKTMREPSGHIDWESFDIAQVLSVRDNLQRWAEIEGPTSGVDWKAYKGLNPSLWEEWRGQMVELAELIQRKLDADEVPVQEFLRLRLGSSAGHEDTVRKLLRKRLGDAWAPEEIDRSATPAQWVALTRVTGELGYLKGHGLPEDPNRRVRINGTWFDADDKLGLFPNSSAYLTVREGYARIGSPHHLRVFRFRNTLKSGKSQTHFGFMRVYAVDLLRFAHGDLFTQELPPQSISRRTADSKVRDALDSGEAQYLGWLVPGDEVVLHSPLTTGAAGALLEVYPAATRWVVAGSDTNAVLSLRPRVLAGEGATPDLSKEVLEVFSGHGWRVSADVFFSQGNPEIIRRDILGRPRLQSHAGLPTCWSVQDT